MKTSNPIAAVEVSVVVKAKPETIFRYFTDPERFSAWLDSPVEMSPELNTTLRIHFDDCNSVVAGKIVEIEQDQKIVFTWGVESGPQHDTMPPGSSTVSITLEASKDGTLVTLRHEGLPDEKERRDHEEGWKGYLEKLNRIVTTS